jgi:electron transfer flavoprotein alpha subunit
LVEAQKASNATMVAATAGSTSRDLLPRAATRLGAAMISDVLSFIDAKTFKRPMWAGNVVATVEVGTPCKFATVRATEFGAPKPGAASATQAHGLTVDLDGLKTKLLARKEIKSTRPDITTATRVVAGGRGTKGPEGFALIEQLADAIGAGIGASRAACDAGWVPNDTQVGQTGKIVAPDLYFAIGISGAIQHVAGMKSSKTIVAINKDPEAPIFQVADYGLVADLFKAVPELVAALKS